VKIISFSSNFCDFFDIYAFCRSFLERLFEAPSAASGDKVLIFIRADKLNDAVTWERRHPACAPR
jgi:hypothetical protein